MNDGSLENILSLLRRLKSTENLSPGNTISQYLDVWCHTGQAVDDVMKFRTAMAIQQQLAQGENYVLLQELPPEAQEGILLTIRSLRNAFSINSMNNTLQSALPSVDTSLSTFAILVGVYRQGKSFRVVPSDTEEIISEIEQFRELIKNTNIDKQIVDVVIKHLALLAGMLRNIEIVGADAALSSYFDLMVKVSKSKVQAELKSSVEVSKWEVVKTWGKRIGAIGSVIDGGADLLEGGEHLAGLISHL